MSLRVSCSSGEWVERYGGQSHIMRLTVPQSALAGKVREIMNRRCTVKYASLGSWELHPDCLVRHNRIRCEACYILLMISRPLIKKNTPVLFATVRAMRVLPVPGGPKRRIARGVHLGEAERVWRDM
jgi:hypothetical protein